MKSTFLTTLLAATVVAAPVAQSNTENAIASVVQGLVAAQASFDVASLDRLLAPEYVEISPVGEVDPRAKVLSFYTPDKKAAAGPVPKVELDEVSTRIFGDTAVTIGRVSFTPPGAPLPAGRMRVVFVLRAAAGQWRLVSSQYTPIREKR
jgi:ketosteroid isomerase-like protein